MTQLQLVLSPRINFDGESFDPIHDRNRLGGQLKRVFELMSDGEYRTLDQIESSCGGSVASVSSRLRDLRKARFGGHQVIRRRITGGLFEYRLVVRK